MSLKVLHLSDTPLSGSPIRISKLLNKHTDVKSRHIVWKPTFGYRDFEYDMIGEDMSRGELRSWLEWPDVIHYHNRWKRQEIFKALDVDPPKLPAVIQIHSPRFSEDFTQEVESKIPLAIIAQYHPRQWKDEMSFMVPNVVDITDPVFKVKIRKARTVPVVSFAPSNTNAKGWDDKGYNKVAPILKRMAMLERKIYFQLINQKPFKLAMELKSGADIAIDEIVTGSYHLSGLEYLAFGVPCFANVDDLTADCVKQVTGCTELPFLKSSVITFKHDLMDLVNQGNWKELGEKAHKWMETYWNPQLLSSHYLDMYKDL